MKEYSVQDLADIRRTFDINNEEGMEDAERRVTEAGGESFRSVTPAEDLNGGDVVPLDRAVAVTELSQSREYQSILDILRDLQTFWSAKAEDVKATQDARTIHANMALGVKKGLAAIGEHVLVHTERLKHTSPAERGALGANAKARIANLTAESVPAPRPEPVDIDDFIDSGWKSDEPESKPFMLDGIQVVKREN
jgi:hypothetical protein